MPAALATASIETAWKPAWSTRPLVTSSSCSRRSGPDIRRLRCCVTAMCNSDPNVGYSDVTYAAVVFRRETMDTLPTHTDVAIVGAGFSGLAMAFKLKAAGRHDFVVLERAAEVGGVWRDNTYPGAACDVPSHVYS